MTRNLLAAILILVAFCLSPVHAQNTTCSTRPVGDNSNACATTKFVNDEISTSGAGTAANMAALRAIVAPTTAISVYILGYFAPGDGGEGRFTYNTSSAATDDAGTIIQPNSLPATGRWLREYISESGNTINVKWFGAKGDGVTSDQTPINSALSLAISVKGGIYFPSTSTVSGGCYRAQVTIPDGTSGLYLKGDAVGYPIFNGPGSAICLVNSALPVLNAVASLGGNINNIYVENLKFWNNNAGQAVKIYGAGFVTMRNIIAYSETGTTFDLKANAYSTFDNLAGYTNSGLALLVSNDPVLTNAGPNTFMGSLFATSGTGQATQIVGDPLSITFINTNFQTAANVSSTQVCSVDIDGPAVGTPIGAVQFLGIHNESNYNFAGTLSDICVGRTHKFGSVAIDAGNSWGAGDSTHFPQYFVHAYAARNLSVKNFTVSKLGSVGYTGAMIRIESGALDQYSFIGNIADTGSGLLYSDANGKCSGTVNCIGGGLILDTLALGAPLPATSGGTGKASYAIGDLLYADAATTLARLADIATTNALISGGVGVAPSWGKIGNSTLVNSSTTVNGQICTLGSTCTVTAAATGITVGTTTVSGGTTTRILYDNVGVLGEYTISGSGTVVAMNTGPTISDPTFTSTVTATGLIKNSDLANMAANTVKANATSGSAVPTNFAMTSCSTAASAVNWTTNTGFGCNTSITANTSTSATNTTNTAITDDVATNAIMFPTWVTANTGNLPQKVSSTLMTWNPATPQLKIGAGADTPVVSAALVYATNNGTSNVVVRDSTNDVEMNMQAASFGGLIGTVTSSPLLIRTNNANQLTISNAGVFTFNTIPAADTATTDSTLCVSTTGIILKGSGALGVCLGTSSARYKHDIVSMGAGLAEIVRLKPKNFFYNKGFGDDGKRQQYGFIAEEVVKVLPGVTAPDKDGKPQSVDMLAMVPVVVNAIKQLKADNDNLRMDVLALQSKAKSNAK